VAYLENGPMKSYKENGFGLSMVERKEDMEPIGMCGILKRESLEQPDIGFAFLPEYHGMGYGQEITVAMLAHARTHLKLKNIWAITVPENERSIRLLKKSGFEFSKMISNEKEELMLFTSMS
jgi:RimJ/RimL family protein N-acetyltransferase